MIISHPRYGLPVSDQTEVHNGITLRKYRRPHDGGHVWVSIDHRIEIGYFQMGNSLWASADGHRLNTGFRHLASAVRAASADVQASDRSEASHQVKPPTERWGYDPSGETWPDRHRR